MDKSFKELLFEKFLEWQKGEKKIKTQKEFADHIGIKEASLNHIMSGRRPPSRRNIEYLAELFKDPRFYDAAEMDRPEPLLTYTKRNWGRVPDETKKRIVEEISHYSDEPVPTEDGSDTPMP
jgi:transcriptional regulator with XRE-family HTH domain